MSTVHGPARSRTVRRPQQQRPLSVVSRPASAHRPRAPFVVLVVALMAVGLVGLLLINTSMQRKAFELTDLRERAANLEKREQALKLDVERLSSPDRIAAEAGRLGMVPNASPAFLRLEDGEVVGQPRPAMPGTNLPGLSAPPAQSGDDANASADGGDGEPDQGQGRDENQDGNRDGGRSGDERDGNRDESQDGNRDENRSGDERDANRDENGNNDGEDSDNRGGNRGEERR